MKEKLMELQKLCDKYSNLPPAWQYSGVPENDCNHFTEMAAKDVLPLYKELCQKVTSFYCLFYCLYFSVLLIHVQRRYLHI